MCEILPGYTGYILDFFGSPIQLLATEPLFQNHLKCLKN